MASANDRLTAYGTLKEKAAHTGSLLIIWSKMKLEPVAQRNTEAGILGMVIFLIYSINFRIDVGQA